MSALFSMISCLSSFYFKTAISSLSISGFLFGFAHSFNGVAFASGLEPRGTCPHWVDALPCLDTGLTGRPLRAMNARIWTNHKRFGDFFAEVPAACSRLFYPEPESILSHYHWGSLDIAHQMNRSPGRVASLHQLKVAQQW